MKAAQITQYNKNIQIKVNDVPIPEMGDHDVLIRVKWQYQLRRHWGYVSSYPGTGVQGNLFF